MGFARFGVIFGGARIAAFWGPCGGPPIYGNHQIYLTPCTGIIGLLSRRSPLHASAGQHGPQRHLKYVSPLPPNKHPNCECLGAPFWASVLIILESYDSVKGLRLPNHSYYLNNTCEKSLNERTSRSCHSICEQMAKCIARRHGSSAHETVESLQDLVVRFLKTIWTGHLGLFGGCPSCIMVVSDPSTAHASTLGRFGDFCRLASLWLRPKGPGTGLWVLFMACT